MTTNQFLLSAWNWNPVVIGVCLLALAGYAWMVRFRFSRSAGFFVGAVLIFFLTLASPVNELADGYLFSAHMLQHLLLLLVIPPLVLLGLPDSRRQESEAGLLATQASASGASLAPKGKMGRQDARPTWGAKFVPSRLHPFAAWLAGLSAMWVWHERTLCNAATTIESVRTIQIVSLIVLGLVFWWPIMGSHKEKRLPPLLGVLYLFSACVGCTILGILITFAPVGVVCPVYMHPVDRLGILPLIRNQWGITSAIDQQAGGLMMWVPACGIYISGVITLLARWYRSEEAPGLRMATRSAQAEIPIRHSPTPKQTPSIS